MAWEQIQGQARVQRVLANQIKLGRTGHAYLFTGMPGTGMDVAARLFAQALNCRGTNRPCGVCASCKAMEKGVHPDVRVIRPDGVSLKLGQIKGITSEAVMTPNLGRYRVYVIEDAHTFTREAANALLLTLEEPASFVVFILTATAPVLVTIESRCQVVKFGRVVNQTLQEQRKIAVRLAADVLTNVLQATQPERAKYAEQLDKEGVDLAELLDGLLRIYRDHWVLRMTGEASLLNLRDLASIVSTRDDIPYLTATVDRLLEAQRMLTHNVNRRLLLETIFAAL